MARTMAQMLIEQGREEGFKLGEEHGELRARQTILLRLLRSRFDRIPAKITKRVKETTLLDQLDGWIDEAAKATKLDDVSLAR